MKRPWNVCEILQGRENPVKIPRDFCKKNISKGREKYLMLEKDREISISREKAVIICPFMLNKKYHGFSLVVETSEKAVIFFHVNFSLS